jgi:diguanylate cyclase (GGDEF)-like protein
MHAAIVDPSQVVLELIATLFTDRGDTVSAFTDSERALDHIKDDPSIDVLLTSFEVEPLPGLELCWQARLAAGTKRPLYIILMSSESDQTHIAQALDCGADDLLAKPICRQELNARLRMAARLEMLQLHLLKLAETDSLTGLHNRRAFFDDLNKCVEERNGRPLSALMVDIDHFKGVNDVHGHHVGDEVIATVAGELKQCGGFSGRLGGEEFAVVLPGTGEAEAFKVAEELRKRCAGLLFQGKDGPFRVTCSIGVASWIANESADDLLLRADMALYEAKAGGRNCTRKAPVSVSKDFRPITRQQNRIGESLG